MKQSLFANNPYMWNELLQVEVKQNPKQKGPKISKIEKPTFHLVLLVFK